MGGDLLKAITLVLTASVFSLAVRADAPTFEAESASEWAGAYWYQPPNSTMTMRLLITPGSQFNLSMGGCWGSSEINRGRIAFRHGVLLLDPKDPFEPGMMHELKSMLPVRFREKLYLVGEDRIEEFVATTGGGNGDCRGYYCQGFFVRESDVDW